MYITVSGLGLFSWPSRSTFSLLQSLLDAHWLRRTQPGQSEGCSLVHKLCQVTSVKQPKLFNVCHPINYISHLWNRKLIFPTTLWEGTCQFPGGYTNLPLCQAIHVPCISIFYLPGKIWNLPAGNRGWRSFESSSLAASVAHMLQIVWFPTASPFHGENQIWTCFGNIHTCISNMSCYTAPSYHSNWVHV